MEIAERIDLLRSLLQSRPWVEVAAPELEARFKSVTVEAMNGVNTLGEANLRSLLAIARENERLLTRWQREIEEFDLTQAVEEAETRRAEEAEQENEVAMTYGHHSPFRFERQGEESDE